MKLSKIFITLLLMCGSLSVNSQDSSNLTKKDETQKSVVIVQSENKKQERTNNTELLPEFGDPKKTFIKKEVEIKNESKKEDKDNTFFGLNRNEFKWIGITVIVSCLFLFGVIRYFLTGKQ